MTKQGDPGAEPPRTLLGPDPLRPIEEGLQALLEVWSPTTNAAATSRAVGIMDAAATSRAVGIADGAATALADAAASAGEGALGGVDVLSDDRLVAAVRAIAQLERSLEGLKLQCSAEIARRSAGASRHEGLAGRHGYATPERFIAAATGSSTADAAKLVAVGAATTQPASFGAAARPPRYANVAAAIGSGSISVEIAHRITTFLDSVRHGVDAPRLECTEQLLLERAHAVGVDGLARYVKLLRAELDPKDVRVREDELHAQRSLRIWEDEHGLVHLRGRFDPTTAAPIKTAVETLVSADLHASRDAKSRSAARATAATPAGSSAHREPDTADLAIVDDRTIEQMTADALADLARLASSAADAPPGLASASVVVRIDHHDLMNDLGFATIDGIDQPISAATARGIAASSGVIPMVCGAAGEVLDLGRRRRLFTKAQRIALAERDGGCAHPDCARPVAHTQAHHIRWWDAHDGPTDLANGVLLCAFHHWCLHHDGWEILNRDGRIWFVPPSHLDPEQRPRPGRRAARLELRAA
ncbi:MAG TPA: DUF222 domain-containing protein [Agromyces mariniharenae]|nr:DUF222 domain-containing protein [Agromyces mariniharenae]